MTTSDSNLSSENTAEKIVFPWQPGYPNGPETVPAAPEAPVEPAPVAVNAPSVAATPTIGSVTGSLASALEVAVLGAAQQAAKASLPDIEKQVISLVTGAIGNVPQPVPPVINSEVFTKAAARSRAFRTFFIGLGLAVFWGFVNALGSLTHADFFSRTGLISIATLLVSSVVGSVVSYIARMKVEPNYVAHQLGQSPPK